MRQKITHGTSIDTATPDEIAAIVAGAFSAQQTEQYRREKGVIPLDATGAGSGGVRSPRLYDYVYERVTLAGAANGLVQLFENQQANSDLLEVIQLGAAGLYSDAFSNKLFVPAGSLLLVVCSGGPASGQLSFNLQTKMLRT